MFLATSCSFLLMISQRGPVLSFSFSSGLRSVEENWMASLPKSEKIKTCGWKRISELSQLCQRLHISTGLLSACSAGVSETVCLAGGFSRTKGSSMDSFDSNILPKVCFINSAVCCLKNLAALLCKQVETQRTQAKITSLTVF